jgi:glycosyltransferase involved in cell wall biosynthesis
MIGSFYTRALKKTDLEIKTVGPEVGGKSDFPVEPRAPIGPAVQAFAPDVLLHFYSKPDYFPPDLYVVDCPKVWVLYDLHLHAEELSRSCCLFDLIVVTDDVMRSKLKRLGVFHVIVIPFAVDQKTFYRPWKDATREFEAGFSGSVTGHPQLQERERLLDAIGEAVDLKVEHRSLTGAQVADFYQRCQLVVNQAVHDDINMRIMETLLAGRPLLTPRVDGLDGILVENEHALFYDSAQDAIEKAKWCLAHPKEAEAMAQRGQEHALSRFTYEKTALALQAHLVELIEQGASLKALTVDQQLWAQFSYHWFRFPGDALVWLLDHWKGSRAPERLLKACIRLSIWVLRAGQAIKKTPYFQKR